jgi:hypothetical protein
MHRLTCEQCHKKFETVRSDTKFCSSTCRSKNHQNKKEDSQNEAGRSIETNADNTAQFDRDYLLIKYRLFKQEKRAILIEQQQMAEECQEMKWEIIQLKKDIKRWLNQISQGELRERRSESEMTDLERENDNVNAIEGLLWGPDASIARSVRISSIKQDLRAVQNAVFDCRNLISQAEVDIDYLSKEIKDNVTQSEKSLEKLETIDLKMEKIRDRLMRPPVSTFQRTGPISLNSVPYPSQKQKERQKRAVDEIGAGDLQQMDFEVYTMPGILGRFLGNLDRNKTCFALTGDSGAGKTHFAFQLAKLFTSALDIKAKLFSLEEGIGEITKEKVSQYDLDNELVISAIGNLHEVRKAAESYSLVIVDSFNKLDAKATDFEKLRNDFPLTIFILIFQKTTSGTMRGGSSIKYDSSATIDVIKRNGQRIAIMEKGRYGTIGWEYSISEDKIIKAD